MASVDAPFVLPFSTSPLDRFGERRRDPVFLERARKSPASRLLLVQGETNVPIDEHGALAWSELSDGESSNVLVFLGVDDAGEALFSREFEDGDVMPDGATFVTLREAGVGLAPFDAAAAVGAVALAAWHRRSPHCVACGGSTIVEDAGHLRRCALCGTSHFPRTDAAVIMLVTDGERCVLGRRAGAPASRWSTLAGFVEPGESLESAVAREVLEEVGIVVHATRYRGSQPWPFPASLMVAFEADATYGPLTINDEHHDVRWFTRDEVANAISAGEMTVPGPISAGSFLIRSWLGPEHGGLWAT
jgi:NAD+ diphosphatase